MEKTMSLLKKRLIVLGVLIALIVTALILIQFPAVSEYAFSRGLTRGLSFLINRVTNYLPFSLYEWTAVLLIALGLAFIVSIIVLLARKKRRAAGTLAYRVLVAVLAIVLAFTGLYGGGYRRQPLNAYLGVSEREVTEEALDEALNYFIGELNASSAQLSRDAAGNVIAPLTFDETADALNAAYDALPDTGYLSRYEVRPKRVVMSGAMSYLGITGIYFPFYAESNINMTVFDAELPFVMAHEMAHAKGVTRENEANFMAFYLLAHFDHPYLRYSGLRSAVSNLLAAMRTCNAERYEEVRAAIDEAVFVESRNIAAAYEKYDTWIGDLSTFFNNLFLKSNGVSEGVKSYGATTKSLLGLYGELTQTQLKAAS